MEVNLIFFPIQALPIFNNHCFFKLNFRFSRLPIILDVKVKIENIGYPALRNTFTYEYA